MSVQYDQATVEQVLAQIEHYTALEQQYERMAQEARAERRKWRGQLAPAQRRAKKAIADARPKRTRGRPFKQHVLSNIERQRRHKLHQQAKKLSTPEVQVICVLKKR